MSRPEPMTVTHLRQQIRAGCTLPVLHRIAGSAAEFSRLDGEYGILPRKNLRTRPDDAPPPPPPVRDRRSEDFLPRGQADLLALIEKQARAGEVFPGSVVIAKNLDCSWLVVERDLRLLERRQLIAIGYYRSAGSAVRRIEIRGKGLQTALPPFNPMRAAEVRA